MLFRGKNKYIFLRFNGSFFCCKFSRPTMLLNSFYFCESFILTVKSFLRTVTMTANEFLVVAHPCYAIFNLRLNGRALSSGSYSQKLLFRPLVHILKNNGALNRSIFGAYSMCVCIGSDCCSGLDSQFHRSDVTFL
jgi:hypothetical protein